MDPVAKIFYFSWSWQGERGVGVARVAQKQLAIQKGSRQSGGQSCEKEIRTFGGETLSHRQKKDDCDDDGDVGQQGLRWRVFKVPNGYICAVVLLRYHHLYVICLLNCLSILVTGLQTIQHNRKHSPYAIEQSL